MPHRLWRDIGKPADVNWAILGQFGMFSLILRQTGLGDILVCTKAVGCHYGLHWVLLIDHRFFGGLVFFWDSQYRGTQG